MDATTTSANFDEWLFQNNSKLSTFEGYDAKLNDEPSTSTATGVWFDAAQVGEGKDLSLIHI